MKQIKKFRKNNWSEEENTVSERKNFKKKKFDRAIRTRDVEFLSDYDEY
jgi:hypothetical protein